MLRSQIAGLGFRSPRNIVGGPVQSEAWETQYPDVLCWNPVIGVLESQADLVWAATEYVLPDVRVHPIPF